MKTTLVAAVLILLFRGVPVAQETTNQTWSFTTNPPQMGDPPDAGFVNPYGTPTFTESAGCVYNNNYDPPNGAGNRQGVWCVPGNDALHFQVPNVTADRQKEITVTTQYYSAAPDGQRRPVVGAGNTSPISQSEVTQGDGWYQHTATFLLNVCISFSAVVARNPETTEVLYVDQVTISTLCRPRPTPVEGSTWGAVKRLYR